MVKSSNKSKLSISPIHVLFESQVKTTPDAIAVSCGNHQLTYKKLDQKANEVALLLNKDISPGDVVAIMMDRSIELIIGLIGILKCGAAYLPLDPSLPKNRLAYMLDNSCVSTLLTQKSNNCLDKIDIDKRLDTQVFFIEDSYYLKPNTNTRKTIQSSSNDLAYVMYTSGSTGMPKGVEITHKGITNVILYRINTILSENKIPVIPLTAAVSFDASIGQIFTPLCSGGQLVIVENLLSLKLSPDFNLITCIGTTPSVIKAYLENYALPPSLEVLFLGGENIEEDLRDILWQQTNIKKLINLYGPTEATVHSSYDIVFERKNNDYNIAQQAITIGRAIDNTDMHILDEELKICNAGVTGEIYISGVGLAKGYRFQQNLTDAKFKSITIGDGSTIRAYQTGDLGQELSDGRIKFVGRKDRQVKIRGFRVELDEIESIFASHPNIQRVAIETTKSITGTNELIAYLVFSENNQSDESEISDTSIKNIISFLKKHLPAYMIPGYYISLNEMPLTPTEKIDRKALPAASNENFYSDTIYAAPENDLQSCLMTIWTKIFNISQIGIHHDFLELGGNSLLAVKVTAKINDACHIQINPGDIFAYPSIKSLCDFITNRQKYSTPNAILLNSVRADNKKHNLFCFSGINIYQPLADKLNSSFCTYGLYSPIEGSLQNATKKVEKGSITLEDIAHQYVDIILKHQNSGPFYFIGVSFGGMVAYEAARILKSKGKNIEHLFLIDPVLASAVKLDTLNWIKQKPLNLINNYAKLFLAAVRKKSESTQTTRHTHDEEIVELRNQHFKSLARSYEKRMETYSGRATLFHSDYREERPGYYIEKECGWSKYINNLDITNMPVTHLGGLRQPHVTDMAQKITSTLKTK